jgi:hypothetical protein
MKIFNRSIDDGIVMYAIIIIIGIISIYALTRSKHSDIVIKTNSDEFIIQSYTTSISGECIMFEYEGSNKIICGKYEIIK